MKNMNSKLILCSRILVFAVTTFYWLVLIWPVFFFCFTLYREWLHYKSSWIVVSRWKVIFNFVRSCMFFCFSIRIMWNLNLFAIIVWDNNNLYLDHHKVSDLLITNVITDRKLDSTKSSNKWFEISIDKHKQLIVSGLWLLYTN